MELPTAKAEKRMMYGRAAIAADKTIIVEVADADLQTLKDAGYKLCFAKMAEGVFDVVWQAYAEFLTINFFEWNPTYQLFGSNVFADNMQVRTTTNVVGIDYGEESTLNEAGILSPASTGGSETAMTLINEYGSIHPGLGQESIGLDGTAESTPIYVAEQAAVIGTYALTTSEQVLIWFEQEIETSTMFSTARSNSIQVDLTSTDLVEVLYQDQAWS